MSFLKEILDQPPARGAEGVNQALKDWCRSYFSSSADEAVITDQEILQEYLELAPWLNDKKDSQPAIAELMKVGQAGATPMVLVQQQTDFEGSERINTFLTQQKNAGAIKGDFYADGMVMIMSATDYEAVQQQMQEGRQRGVSAAR
jgi:hypothetical protein